VACIEEMRNRNKILVGEPDGNRPPDRPMHICEVGHIWYGIETALGSFEHDNDLQVPQKLRNYLTN
jgi:hypothetical protein